MITEAILGLVGTAVSAGALGWIFQLGNRITVLETKEPDLKDLIDSKFEGVYQRLDRIERAMNGNLYGEDE